MEAAAGALQLRRAGVTAELRALASELRQARSAADARCSGAPRRWQLDVRIARVVWILYSLIADPSPVLLHYLRGVRAYSDAREWDDGALLELSDRSFLGADFAELVAIVDEENSSDARAMRTAKRLLAEWRLFRWCEAQNVTNRTAPSTAALLGQARVDSTAFPASVFKLNTSGNPASSAREWARRWRERWGARMGSVRAYEQMSIDEMRLKVRCAMRFALVCCARGRWAACRGLRRRVCRRWVFWSAVARLVDLYCAYFWPPPR